MKIPKGYIPMKQGDIKTLRRRIWESNSRKCPVLNKEIRFEDTALDHQHKTQAEPFSPDKGVIRECLDFRTNQVLGKLENSLKRTGLQNDPDFNLPEFLRGAADYFEKGQYQDKEGNYYIHPKEMPKIPEISKRNYNKLQKLYLESGNKKKFPEYPRSKKLTKPLQVLFEEFNVPPYN